MARGAERAEAAVLLWLCGATSALGRGGGRRWEPAGSGREARPAGYEPDRAGSRPALANLRASRGS